ncbi:MAG: hypothetical protein WBC74_04070 [Candidatus Omnitrophota bacterium]
MGKALESLTFAVQDLSGKVIFVIGAGFNRLTGKTVVTRIDYTYFEGGVFKVVTKTYTSDGVEEEQQAFAANGTYADIEEMAAHLKAVSEQTGVDAKNVFLIDCQLRTKDGETANVSSFRLDEKGEPIVHIPGGHLSLDPTSLKQLVGVEGAAINGEIFKFAEKTGLDHKIIKVTGVQGIPDAALGLNEMTQLAKNHPDSTTWGQLKKIGLRAALQYGLKWWGGKAGVVSFDEETAWNAAVELGKQDSEKEILKTVGRVYVGIATLGISELIIWQWDNIKDAAGRAWNFVKEYAPIVGRIYLAITTLGISELIIWQWDNIKAGASAVWYGTNYGTAYAMSRLFGFSHQQAKSFAAEYARTHQSFTAAMAEGFGIAWNFVKENSSTIGRVYLGIVTLGISELIIWQWDNIKDMAGRAWGFVKENASTIGRVCLGIVTLGISELIRWQWDNIKDMAGRAWGFVKENASTIGRVCLGIVTLGISELIIWQWDNIKDAAGRAWNFVKEYAPIVGILFAFVASEILDAVIGVAGDAVKDLKSMGIVGSGVGVAGGAAAGAAIGAAIGVWFFGVGALVGAAIGAAIGAVVGLTGGILYDTGALGKIKGSIGGVAGGAALGALVGSIIPGVGTAIGALVGAIVGLIAGVSVDLGIFGKIKGSLTGVAGGAALGALIGSVFPVIGTAIGAIIGAGIGLLLGILADTSVIKIKGTATGVLGGAAIGAAIGSVIPVIGTGIGAIVGAIVGLIAGGAFDLGFMDRNAAVGTATCGATGAVIGAAIGVWFFGVGALVGAAVGAAIGLAVGVIGGVIASAFGAFKDLDKKLVARGMTTDGVLANVGTFAGTLAVLGGIIGTCITPFIGTLIGFAIGAVVGAIVGVVVSLVQYAGSNGSGHIDKEGNVVIDKPNTAFGYQYTAGHALMDTMAVWAEKSDFGRVVFEIANGFTALVRGLSLGIGGIGDAFRVHEKSTYIGAEFWRGYTWGDAIEIVGMVIAACVLGKGVAAIAGKINAALTGIAKELISGAGLKAKLANAIYNFVSKAHLFFRGSALKAIFAGHSAVAQYLTIKGATLALVRTTIQIGWFGASLWITGRAAITPVLMLWFGADNPTDLMNTLAQRPEGLGRTIWMTLASFGWNVSQVVPNKFVVEKGSVLDGMMNTTVRNPMFVIVFFALGPFIQIFALAAGKFLGKIGGKIVETLGIGKMIGNPVGFAAVRIGAGFKNVIVKFPAWVGRFAKRFFKLGSIKGIWEEGIKEPILSAILQAFGVSPATAEYLVEFGDVSFGSSFSNTSKNIARGTVEKAASKINLSNTNQRWALQDAGIDIGTVGRVQEGTATQQEVNILTNQLANADITNSSIKSNLEQVGLLEVTQSIKNFTKQNAKLINVVNNWDIKALENMGLSQVQINDGHLLSNLRYLAMTGRISEATLKPAVEELALSTQLMNGSAENLTTFGIYEADAAALNKLFESNNDALVKTGKMLFNQIGLNTPGDISTKAKQTARGVVIAFSGGVITDSVLDVLTSLGLSKGERHLLAILSNSNEQAKRLIITEIGNNLATSGGEFIRVVISAVIDHAVDSKGTMNMLNLGDRAPPRIAEIQNEIVQLKQEISILENQLRDKQEQANLPQLRERIKNRIEELTYAPKGAAESQYQTEARFRYNLTLRRTLEHIDSLIAQIEQSGPAPWDAIAVAINGIESKLTEIKGELLERQGALNIEMARLKMPTYQGLGWKQEAIDAIVNGIAILQTIDPALAHDAKTDIAQAFSQNLGTLRQQDIGFHMKRIVMGALFANARGNIEAILPALAQLGINPTAHDFKNLTEKDTNTIGEHLLGAGFVSGSLFNNLNKININNMLKNSIIVSTANKEKYGEAGLIMRHYRLDKLAKMDSSEVTKLMNELAMPLSSDYSLMQEFLQGRPNILLRNLTPETLSAIQSLGESLPYMSYTQLAVFAIYGITPMNAKAVRMALEAKVKDPKGMVRIENGSLKITKRLRTLFRAFGIRLNNAQKEISVNEIAKMVAAKMANVEKLASTPNNAQYIVNSLNTLGIQTFRRTEDKGKALRQARAVFAERAKMLERIIPIAEKLIENGSLDHAVGEAFLRKLGTQYANLITNARLCDKLNRLQTKSGRATTVDEMTFKLLKSDMSTVQRIRSFVIGQINRIKVRWFGREQAVRKALKKNHAAANSNLFTHIRQNLLPEDAGVAISAIERVLSKEGQKEKVTFEKALNNQGISLKSERGKAIREALSKIPEQITSNLRGRMQRKAVVLDATSAFILATLLADGYGFAPHKEQSYAGKLLAEEIIIQMGTGEGKTLTSVLALYLHALTGKSAHQLVTADFLAERDFNETKPIFDMLGIEPSFVTRDMGISEDAENRGEKILEAKRKAYSADVVYVANTTVRFDKLHDLRTHREEEKYITRELNYANVDEIDNITLDQALSECILSEGAGEPLSAGEAAVYIIADKIARRIRPEGGEVKVTLKDVGGITQKLETNEYYSLNRTTRTLTLKEEGKKAVGRLIQAIRHEGVMKNMTNLEEHHIQRALEAHLLYHEDIQYRIETEKDGKRKLIIVSEATGRDLEGQRWEDGLAQAVEAKEGLDIHGEYKTIAKMSIRDLLVNEYKHFSGCSGTVMEAEKELRKLFNREVVRMPPHSESLRKDNLTEIVLTGREKVEYIKNKIYEIRNTRPGAPILVTFRNMDDAKAFHRILISEGIVDAEHMQLLDASLEWNEEAIVETAGTPGMVTIATNIAGRATDIKLPGRSQILEEASRVLTPAQKQELGKLIDRLNENRNPKAMKEKAKEVRDFFKRQGIEAPELMNMVFTTYVFGLQLIREVNKSRRIDRQADGRVARQDNPGEAWSVMSLEGADLAMLERGLAYKNGIYRGGNILINILIKSRYERILKIKPALKEIKQALEEGRELTDSQRNYIRKATRYIRKSTRKAQDNIDKAELRMRASAARFNTFEYRMQKSYHELRNAILGGKSREITIDSILETATLKLVEKYRDQKAEFNFKDMLGAIKSRFSISLEGITEDSIRSLDNNGLAQVILQSVIKNVSQADLMNIVTQSIDDMWVEFLANSRKLRREVRFRKYAGKMIASFKDVMENFTDKVANKLAIARESKAESLSEESVRESISQAEKSITSHLAELEIKPVKEHKPGMLDRAYSRLFGPRMVQTLVRTAQAQAVERADSAVAQREVRKVDVSQAVNEAKAEQRRKETAPIRITNRDRAANTATLKLAGIQDEYKLPIDTAEALESYFAENRQELENIINSKDIFVMPISGHYIVIGYRNENTFVLEDLGKTFVEERVISPSVGESVKKAVAAGALLSLLAIPVVGWLAGAGFVTFGGLLATGIFGLTGTSAMATGNIVSAGIMMSLVMLIKGKARKPSTLSTLKTKVINALSVARKVDNALDNLIEDLNKGIGDIDQRKAVKLALADLERVKRQLASGDIKPKEARRVIKISTALDSVLRRLNQAETAANMASAYEKALGGPNLNKETRKKIQAKLGRIKSKDFERQRKETLAELDEIYKQLEMEPIAPKLEQLEKEVITAFDRANEALKSGKLEDAKRDFEEARSKYEMLLKLNPKISENEDFVRYMKDKIDSINLWQKQNAAEERAALRGDADVNRLIPLIYNAPTLDAAYNYLTQEGFKSVRDRREVKEAIGKVREYYIKALAYKIETATTLDEVIRLLKQNRRIRGEEEVRIAAKEARERIKEYAQGDAEEANRVETATAEPEKVAKKPTTLNRATREEMIVTFFVGETEEYTAQKILGEVFKAQAAEGNAPAYSTVLRDLNRLVNEGILTKERHDRNYYKLADITSGIRPDGTKLSLSPEIKALLAHKGSARERAEKAAGEAAKPAVVEEQPSEVSRTVKFGEELAAEFGVKIQVVSNEEWDKINEEVLKVGGLPVDARVDIKRRLISLRETPRFGNDKQIIIAHEVGHVIDEEYNITSLIRQGATDRAIQEIVAAGFGLDDPNEVQAAKFRMEKLRLPGERRGDDILHEAIAQVIALSAADREGFRAKFPRVADILYAMFSLKAQKSTELPPMGGGLDARDLAERAETMTAEQLVGYLVTTGLFTQAGIIREALASNPDKLAELDRDLESLAGIGLLTKEKQRDSTGTLRNYYRMNSAIPGSLAGDIISMMQKTGKQALTISEARSLISAALESRIQVAGRPTITVFTWDNIIQTILPYLNINDRTNIISALPKLVLNGKLEARDAASIFKNYYHMIHNDGLENILVNLNTYKITGVIKNEDIETLLKYIVLRTGRTEPTTLPPMGGGLDARDLARRAETMTAEQLVGYLVTTGLFMQTDIIREALASNSDKLAKFERLLAQTKAEPATLHQKLEEIEKGLTSKVTSHLGSIGEFETFVRTQADAQGIKISDRQLTLAEFNREKIRGIYDATRTFFASLIKFDRKKTVFAATELVGHLLSFITQQIGPATLVKFDKDEKITEIVYSPNRGKLYPTHMATWAMFGLAYSSIHGFVPGILVTLIGYGIVAPIIWSTTRFMQKAEGHELAHILQIVTLEGIRKELGYEMRPKKFQRLVSDIALQKAVHSYPAIRRDAPTTEQARRVVSELFNEVRVSIKVQPTPVAEAVITAEEQARKALEAQGVENAVIEQVARPIAERVYESHRGILRKGQIITLKFEAKEITLKAEKDGTKLIDLIKQHLTEEAFESLMAEFPDGVIPYEVSYEVRKRSDGTVEPPIFSDKAGIIFNEEGKLIAMTSSEIFSREAITGYRSGEVEVVAHGHSEPIISAVNDKDKLAMRVREVIYGKLLPEIIFERGATKAKVIDTSIPQFTEEIERIVSFVRAMNIERMRDGRVERIASPMLSIAFAFRGIKQGIELTIERSIAQEEAAPTTDQIRRMLEKKGREAELLSMPIPLPIGAIGPRLKTGQDMEDLKGIAREIEETGALSMESMLVFLENQAGILQGAQVLVFDKSAVDDSVIELAERLAKAEGGLIRVAVIGERIPGAIYIPEAEEGTLSDRIAHAVKRELGDHVDIAKIAIALKGEESTLNDVILEDLRAKENTPLRMASYVALKEGAEENAQINMANLLLTVVREKPCFVGIGYDKTAFGSIKSLLEKIGGYFSVITKISEGLSEIFKAIRQTITAV